ncbi:MAG TPA: ribose 5-phosphate isomerase B [Acholeplasma sp.]|jgi:ribose 5-phosphate isomerase B|nr:ribose 5-phosphate isomerase B [Acholeplasmatales bacterium]HHV33752.1 ribose 5-phosphate isomerase B [Acholeplasma sp.]
MIVIASDHAGFKLKEGLIKYFNENQIAYKDLGTNNEESVDYPDYGIKLAEEFIKGGYELGIVICGTGIGISIAANKVKGIRAALIYSLETAELAKKHNDANVISFGGRTTKLEDAIKYLEVYRQTKFEKRHQKRIDKINEYEVK